MLDTRRCRPWAPAEQPRCTTITGRTGLPNTNLGPVPPEIDLSDGPVIEAIPPRIGDYAGLEKLHLYFNHIATNAPEIGKLRRLTSLDLRGNKLRQLPDEILPNTNLGPVPLDRFLGTGSSCLCCRSSEGQVVPRESAPWRVRACARKFAVEFQRTSS